MRYDIHLKGFVGGYDFDDDYVDYIVDKYADQPLYVLIDSTGGSARAGFAIQHAFRRHGNVTVHMSGYCASAATIAALGAKHVEIDSSAFFLIHNASLTSQALAKPFKAADVDNLIAELKKCKDHLSDLDSAIAQVYRKRCTKSDDELIALMSEDRWLSAAAAKEWGFVDAVVEDSEPLALSEIEILAFKEAGLPEIPKDTDDSGDPDNAEDDHEDKPGDQPEEQPGLLARIHAAIDAFMGRSAVADTSSQNLSEDTPDDAPDDTSGSDPQDPGEAGPSGADTPEDDRPTPPVKNSGSVPNPPKPSNNDLSGFAKSMSSARDLFNSLP